MKKTSKLLVACLALLILVCSGVGAFGKQEVDKHTVHFGGDPLSWIYGVYSAEVGVPITGLIEVSAQLLYWDSSVIVKWVEETPDVYFKQLHVGPVVRFFPSLNATGFFVSGRLMYLNYVWVVGPVKNSYNDGSIGVDLGWRYLWQFPGHWGMYIQTYGGLERHLFTKQITTAFGFPIIPVWGFHLGFHL